jgi:6-phosphogluconolactonase (cycloisomerase 2 family)
MEFGPRRVTRLLFFFSLSLAILLSSCGGGGNNGSGPNPTPTPAEVSLTSIAVTPSAPTIAFGATQQFKATGSYSDGSTKDLTSVVVWESSATTIATIAPGGLATSVAQGAATISAVSGSVSGSTTLTIGPPPAPSLKTITVSPAASTIALGHAQQFSALGTYSDGTTKDLTSTATWSSSTTSVVTINSSGLATSIAQGTATISALSGNVTGSAKLTVGSAPAAPLTSITVSPATATVALGLTQQFSAQGTYSDGSTGNLSSSVTWSSLPISVVTLNASGLATSQTQGVTTITATSGSISGTATLTVGPPQLTGISVSPSTIFVSRGSSQAFTATGTYTDGSTADLTSTVSWKIVNPYIATGAVGTSSVIGSKRSFASAGTNSGGSSASFNADAQRDGFTAISAGVGAFSANSKLTVVSPARFAYVTHDLGDSVSFYTVDGSTGDLRMRGYKSTIGYAPFTDCVTLDPTASFAYVVDPESSGGTPNIRIYQVDAVLGALTELSGSPFSTSMALSCLQFEPSGKFGYAVSHSSGTNDLVGYSRDASTGLLTELPWSPMTVGDSPTSLAIDPIGQYLYFVNMEINTGKPTTIAGYSIDNATGDLTPINGMPLAVSNTTDSVAIVHPSGNFAYVSHGGGNTVDVYAIDRSSGALTWVPGSTVATAINPSSLVFSVDGSYAYMNAAMSSLGNTNSGTITTFHVDNATGKLTAIGSVAAGTIPGALAIDPSGQFLYSSDNGTYLRVYKIQADGSPKYVRSIATRQGQMSIAILGGDTASSYKPAALVVTTSADNQITGYAIGADGSLTKGTSIATPAKPNSVTLLPWGAKAILSATGAPSGSNLGAYHIDPSTGNATYEAFLGNAVTAGGSLMEPSEGYAFQSDSAAGMLRVYRGFTSLAVDYWNLVTYVTSTGAQYSTFSAGAGAGPMTMVPSGRYLYVANQGANSISAFAFWGELFEETAAYTSPYADGSPYAIGAEPIALAADPMGLYIYIACGDNTIRVYSVDSWSGGHLKQVAIANLTAAPTAVAVDPTGHFVYVGDASGNVAPFGVDTGSGALTPLTPSVLPAAVTSLTLESSGQFAYILCGPVGGAGGNNGSINAFRVNADGTLTGLSAGPWLANQPSAIAFTDSVQ